MNTQALQNLGQFTGAEHYYRNPIHGRFSYTDGVRYLCEHADCYWLLDVIASYQPDLRKNKDTRLQDLQFWSLKVNSDHSAVVTCVADSDEPPVVTQTVPWTDFPLDSIDIWVGRDPMGMIAYLPSEH